MKPFLILSHHRSGSNFLSNAVQLNSKVECLNEPLSMHTNVFRENDLKVWNKNDYIECELHRLFHDYPNLKEYLIELRQFLNNPYPYHVRGFKETTLFEKLGWLKEFIPDLKIIYLVRNPNAVINSIIRRRMWDFWNYSVLIPRYMQNNYNDIKINPDNPVELCTWSWKIRNELCMKELNRFDNVIIRLEDLISYPEEKLTELMNFIGVEVEKKQIDFVNESHKQTKGKTFSSQRSLSEILELWKGGLSEYDKKYIETCLRDEMVRFAYI
ncbi:sulfotransferase [Clostridium beijerinckii]|uniref:sulfotransferase n=1 Tax=Clostridium beijerinckii TaxID=1520 RepID=UPI001493F5C6|nr:sulfotransferase [Clostridium beijerinckii]NOW07507.1 hypothetical protein [Clostridium beijerinckii]NYC04720.1 hypothetical protein [Clostridium beijerinckii]UYZ35677.1 sulfotransferase [Clostridium beijerinckii]